MNRLTINVEALRYNYETVLRWITDHGGQLTVVTKALCGHPEILEALQGFGVGSMGDSRVENLTAVRAHAPGVETWYLRPPHASAIRRLVPLCDVSLNSEMSTLHALHRACREMDTEHQVVLMVELGDLREGVLPGKLLEMTEEILRMPRIRLIGLGANLGCLNGAIPMAEELAQLSLYHELLELKFDVAIPYVSAGTSAGLGLLRDGEMPAAINHFRVGESILLGTDPVNGGDFPGLRQDVACLEAEVIELKEKRLTSSSESGQTPFEPLEVQESVEPGQRGVRALVTVGHVDTDIQGLTPLSPDHTLAGASSDVTVVNLTGGERGVSLGRTIRFRPNYSAFVRLMNNPYTEKRVLGCVERKDRASCPVASRVTSRT